MQFSRANAGRIRLNCINIRTRQHQFGNWAVASDTRILLCLLGRESARTEPRKIQSVVGYVGFFDGGSRGNPGFGGCGSVLLRVEDDGEPRIIWVSSISIGPATCTNNVAEFRGIYNFLYFIASRKLTQVHIVGDSQLILRLMRERSPPRSKHLKNVT
ncbi:Ribonuclease HI [Phytophthora megakarya]|uniref:Ribonuclease HI n=1 Tax=Phytophthora megakarya TaxID=4795 RepID=A0A225UPI9_9STRA|nr:Ribonuclease HI [Phytophthora megakarya]